MNWLIWIVLGSILGFIVSTVVLYKTSPIGTIQIDTSGEKADIYRFVWNEDPTKLKKKKVVLFEIDPNAKLREKGNDYSD